MSTYEDRSHWKAEKPEKQMKILSLLRNGSKTYGQLLKEVKWGTQTLSNYLKALKEKGWIDKSSKRGRNIFYTLMWKNLEVREMLSLDRLPSIRIDKRVELGKINEEELVNNFFISINSCVKNIIEDSIYLGQMKDSESEKKIRHFLEAHISYLAATSLIHSELMAKRIKNGTLNPEKIREVKNK